MVHDGNPLNLRRGLWDTHLWWASRWCDEWAKLDWYHNSISGSKHTRTASNKVKENK